MGIKPNTMKNKLMYSLAALVLVFGLIFGMSAFTPQKSTMLAYQYTGEDDEDVMNLSNWSAVPYEENPSTCDVEGRLVCIVQFKDTDFSNISDFLDNHTDATEVNKSPYVARYKEPIN